ncbi:hypothetical protein C1645_835228 [Glomus cerebriforme]|uniref:Uncharacterized protein n=1 Tax=Glomus cerebriforme TaxID=658196 RepID=A0A397SCG3_9GLOM|nr:hypothetical protein C1645_835228 [Glomus cerebriforme]
MSYKQETDIWKDVLINEDDFEFNSDNDENILMLNDDDNLISTATNIGSFTKSISDDAKISQFTWDKTAFQKAQESFLLKAKNDEINWEDIDYEESFKTESTITKLTEEESNYQLENTNDTLTHCVILDMIDNKI